MTDRDPNQPGAPRTPPKTFEETAPDPDRTAAPIGRNVMLVGGIFTAILTLVISLFSLLFAPRLTGTPTPRITPTDQILAVYQTETPTPTLLTRPTETATP